MVNVIEKIQEKSLVSVFRDAAKNNPFYKSYLKQSNVDFHNIKNIGNFKDSVPLLNKEKLFTFHLSNINHICTNGNIKECKSIFPSSGYSGKPSFGLFGKDEYRKRKNSIDNILNRVFDTAHKKTLLINTLSMGIAIPASSVTMVNTGLRSDTALFVVKTLGNLFEQIIIVGENLFIKNLLEEGLDKGLSWQDYYIHVIFGGESFPESFREYLGRTLGITPDSKKEILVGSSFGFAEIGLNVLWETRRAIQIRKKASQDEKLRTALLERHLSLCPIFFQYDPHDVYVEELNGQLIFTSLNAKARLPIIRYATGDEGFIIPFDKLKDVLTASGLKECIPSYKIPLVAVKNRGEYIDFNGNKIYPDMIKDVIYSHVEIPRLVTGFFKMKRDGNRLTLEIQLKKNIAPAKEAEDRLKSALNKSMGLDLNLVFHPYNKYPYAMELDFERKAKYI